MKKWEALVGKRIMTEPRHGKLQISPPCCVVALSALSFPCSFSPLANRHDYAEARILPGRRESREIMKSSKVSRFCYPPEDKLDAQVTTEEHGASS